MQQPPDTHGVNSENRPIVAVRWTVIPQSSVKCYSASL